jgi:dipeptidyl aminopeptidase/acylaminoacyl peptidase
MTDPVSIEDLRSLKLISDPQISPTGDRVAFVVTTLNATSNEYNSNIWIADIQTGAIQSFTSGRGKDKYPRWAPDGSTLLFLSVPLKTQWHEKAQLFTIPVSGGEAVQLTNLQSGVQSPQWSPNSQQILFTSLTQETETPETDVKIIRRIAYRFNEKGYFEGKRNHLFTITPSNPNPIQITHGAYDVESPDWVDNNQIAFLSNLTADADVTRDKYIYRVSSINGEPIQITQLKQAISALKVAPNGDEIAYLGHDYRFGLATFQDIWIVSKDGESSTNLTKAFDYDIGNSVICDTRIDTQAYTNSLEKISPYRKSLGMSIIA